MIPVEVVVENRDPVSEMMANEQESEFYACQVCGDNRLSIKESDTSGDLKITLIYQMGMSPTLKRIARAGQGTGAAADSLWSYFADEEEIGEASWQIQLDRRREILRSICSN